MVKGNSRQVILVDHPDQKLFEQAIFILKDEAVTQGVTEDLLLREARKVLHAPKGKRKPLWYYGPVWAVAGAVVTGAIWLLTTAF